GCQLARDGVQRAARPMWVTQKYRLPASNKAEPATHRFRYYALWRVRPSAGINSEWPTECCLQKPSSVPPYRLCFRHPQPPLRNHEMSELLNEPSTPPERRSGCGWE